LTQETSSKGYLPKITRSHRFESEKKNEKEIYFSEWHKPKNRGENADSIVWKEEKRNYKKF
jgi:hypothetical protein